MPLQICKFMNRHKLYTNNCSNSMTRHDDIITLIITSHFHYRTSVYVYPWEFSSQTLQRNEDSEEVHHQFVCCLQYGLLQKLHLGSCNQHSRHKKSPHATSSSSSDPTHPPQFSHLGIQNMHPLHWAWHNSLLLQSTFGQSYTILTSKHLGHFSKSIILWFSLCLNTETLPRLW